MRDSFLVLLGMLIGSISMWAWHDCPYPQLMTRPQMQKALRAYDPNLVIDGEIGSRSNAAWKLHEDAEYEKEWCEMYERGIK